jgi:hypothetical protein
VETPSPEPVFSGRRRVYKVRGPWRGGSRYVIVADTDAGETGGVVVATDHKPWLGFGWAALRRRLDRPEVTYTREGIVTDANGRAAMWLSLEELHILVKALKYMIAAEGGRNYLTPDEARLAMDTLTEVRRVAMETEERRAKEAPADAPVD